MEKQENDKIYAIIFDSIKDFHGKPYQYETQVGIFMYQLYNSNLISFTFIERFIKVTLMDMNSNDIFNERFYPDLLAHDNNIDNIKMLLPDLKELLNAYFVHKKLLNNFTINNFTLDKIRDRNINKILD
jgi:hypothetical protein